MCESLALPVLMQAVNAQPRPAPPPAEYLQLRDQLKYEGYAEEVVDPVADSGLPVPVEVGVDLRAKETVASTATV